MARKDWKENLDDENILPLNTMQSISNIWCKFLVADNYLLVNFNFAINIREVQQLPNGILIMQKFQEYNNKFTAKNNKYLKIKISICLQSEKYFMQNLQMPYLLNVKCWSLGSDISIFTDFNSQLKKFENCKKYWE